MEEIHLTVFFQLQDLSTKKPQIVLMKKSLLLSIKQPQVPSQSQKIDLPVFSFQFLLFQLHHQLIDLIFIVRFNFNKIIHIFILMNKLKPFRALKTPFLLIFFFFEFLQTSLHKGTAKSDKIFLPKLPKVLLGNPLD